MGRNHARVLSEMPTVELVGIADTLSLGEDAFGGERQFIDLDVLLGMDLDFAIVATPTSTHEEIANRLLAHRINVLVEKPLAQDLQAASRIVEACREAGVVGAVGHVERYNPALRELKRRLEKNEIGEILQIATRRQGSFPTRINDVGVTFDLATHDLDATMWISGARYSSLSANASHRSGRSREDMILITGSLTNGIIVNHVVNWLSPMKERIVVVTGDRGTFVADLVAGDLTLHENGAFQVSWESLAAFRGVAEGNTTRLAFDKKEPLRGQLEDFVRLLEGEFTDNVSLAEGANVVAVAEAAVRSSQLGEVVSVGPYQKN